MLDSCFSESFPKPLPLERSGIFTHAETRTNFDPRLALGVAGICLDTNSRLTSGSPWRTQTRHLHCGFPGNSSDRRCGECRDPFLLGGPGRTISYSADQSRKGEGERAKCSWGQYTLCSLPEFIDFTLSGKTIFVVELLWWDRKGRLFQRGLH